MTGSDLQDIRQLFGFSRRQLGQRIGVHPDTIRYWERKIWANPEANVPSQILQEFGVGNLDVSMLLNSERYRRLFTHPERKGARSAKVVEPTQMDRNACKPNDAKKCAAKTRAGSLCKAKRVPGRARCRMHGGLSTGPKTELGRQRIAEAQKQRWKKVR